MAVAVVACQHFLYRISLRAAVRDQERLLLVAVSVTNAIPDGTYPGYDWLLADTLSVINAL